MASEVPFMSQKQNIFYKITENTDSLIVSDCSGCYSPAMASKSEFKCSKPVTEIVDGKEVGLYGELDSVGCLSPARASPAFSPLCDDISFEGVSFAIGESIFCGHVDVPAQVFPLVSVSSKNVAGSLDTKLQVMSDISGQLLPASAKKELRIFDTRASLVQVSEVDSWEDWADEGAEEELSNLEKVNEYIKIKQFFKENTKLGKVKEEIEDESLMNVRQLIEKQNKNKYRVEGRHWVTKHPRFVAKRDWLRTDYRKRQAMENSLDPFRHEFGRGYEAAAYFPKQIGTYLNPRMGLFREIKQVVDEDLIVTSDLKKIKRKLLEYVPVIHKHSPFDLLVGARTYFFREVVYLLLYDGNGFIRYRLKVNQDKCLEPRKSLINFLKRYTKIRIEHESTCRMSYCSGCLMNFKKEGGGWFSVAVDADDAIGKLQEGADDTISKMGKMLDDKFEKFDQRVSKFMEVLPEWKELSDNIKKKTAWMDDLTDFTQDHCKPLVKKVKNTVDSLTRNTAMTAALSVAILVVMILGLFLLYRGFYLVWDLLIQLLEKANIKPGLAQVMAEAGRAFRNDIVMEAGGPPVKSVISFLVCIVLWACGMASYKEGDLKNKIVVWCASYITLRKGADLVVDDIFSIIKMIANFLQEQWGISFLKNMCESDGDLAMLLQEAESHISRIQRYGSLEEIAENMGEYTEAVLFLNQFGHQIREMMYKPSNITNPDRSKMIQAVMKQYDDVKKIVVDLDVMFRYRDLLDIRRRYEEGTHDLVTLSRGFYFIADRPVVKLGENLITKDIRQRMDKIEDYLRTKLPREVLLAQDPRTVEIMRCTDEIVDQVENTNELDYQDWQQLVQYKFEINIRLTEQAQISHKETCELLKAALAKIESVLKRFGTRGSKGNGYRVQPTGILLAGKARTGKNTIMMFLVQALVAKFGTARQKEALLKAYNTVVYNWASEIEFHDGYFGQMITIIDELMQVNESVTEDPVFMQVLRLINTNQADVNMANLSGKSGVSFLSKFILSTSNQISVQGVKGINDLGAFVHRFNSFLVAPAVKNSTPESVAKYRNTLNPYDLEPAYIRRTGSQVDPTFWSIYKLDLFTGKTIGDHMNLDQFMSYVLTVAEREQTSGQQRLDSQQRTAEIFCNPEVLDRGDFIRTIMEVQGMEPEPPVQDFIFHDEEVVSASGSEEIVAEAGILPDDEEKIEVLWTVLTNRFQWLADEGDVVFELDIVRDDFKIVMDYCLSYHPHVVDYFLKLKGFSFFSWYRLFPESIVTWVRQCARINYEDVSLILKSYLLVYTRHKTPVRIEPKMTDIPPALVNRLKSIDNARDTIIDEYETASDYEEIEEDSKWTNADWQVEGRSLATRVRLFMDGVGEAYEDFDELSNLDYRKVTVDVLREIVRSSNYTLYIRCTNFLFWEYARLHQNALFPIIKHFMQRKYSIPDMVRLLDETYMHRYDGELLSMQVIMFMEAKASGFSRFVELLQNCVRQLLRLPVIITVICALGAGVAVAVLVAIIRAMGCGEAISGEKSGRIIQAARDEVRMREWSARRMRAFVKQQKDAKPNSRTSSTSTTMSHPEAGRITDNDTILAGTLLDKNVFQLYSEYPTPDGTEVICHGMLVFFARRSAYLPFHCMHSWTDVCHVVGVKHYIRNNKETYEIDYFTDLYDVTTLDTNSSDYEYDLALLTFVEASAMKSKFPDRKNTVRKHVSCVDKNLQHKFHVTIVKPSPMKGEVTNRSSIALAVNILAEKNVSNLGYDKFRAMDSIYYSTITGGGCSGAAILLTGDDKFPEARIFGIHVGRGGDRCFGIPVYKEILVQYEDEIQKMQKLRKSDISAENERPCGFIKESGTLPKHLRIVRECEPDGRPIACNAPRQDNDIQPTEIHGKIWPVNEKLSQLVPTMEQMLRGEDRWKIAREKYCKKSGTVDNRIETLNPLCLRKVTNFLYNSLSAEGKELDPGELVYPSFQEIVLGYPDGSIEGIPLDTSAGWPKNLRHKKKYTIMGDQKPGLDEHEIEKFMTSDRMLKLHQEFDDCLESLRQGVLPELVFSDFPKAEVVDLSKEKIRVVSGSPLMGQILERYFLMPFIKWLRKYRITNRQAIGINTFKEAEVTVRYLEFLNRIIAGDHKGWDTDYEKQLWDEIFHMVDRFYGNKDPMRTLFLTYLSESKHITVDYELPEKIYDKISKTMISTKDIIYDDSKKVFMASGRVLDLRKTRLKHKAFIYQWYGGMSSGAWVTADFNSLGNNIKTLYMACYIVLKKRNLTFDESMVHDVLPSVLRGFRTLTFGDDIIAAVSPDLPELDQYSLCEAFSDHGSIFTDADKGAFDKPFCKLEGETSFLCRKFRYESGRWYIVLDFSSIYSRFNWVSDKKREDEIMRDNCLQANIELGGYSEKEYNFHMEKYLRPIAVRYKYEPLPFKLARERFNGYELKY